MADLKTCGIAGIDATPAPSTGGFGTAVYCSYMMEASGHHVVQWRLFIFGVPLVDCRPTMPMGY